MADRITKEHRSWNMSRIKGSDTKPERMLRSALHQAGFRFRLHDKRLSGKPDLVLKKYKTVIFVHGCFWHRHKDCDKAYTPKSNIEFWENKFRRTVERDKQQSKELSKSGWEVIIIWECQIERDLSSVVALVRACLKTKLK